MKTLGVFTFLCSVASAILTVMGHTSPWLSAAAWLLLGAITVKEAWANA